MALKGAKGTVTIIDKATKSLRSIADAFKNMGSASKSTNKDLSRTQRAIDGISKVQNRLGRSQAHIKRHTQDIGSQAVGVAALALSFKAALSPAIKFEQSMKDLQAVAFGASDSTVPVAKNMKLLSDQAKQLGASTAFSATQAAEGQIFLAKAGFKTNQILQAMPALLDLAAASGTDLGRSSDILSDLLGAFGMSAKDTGKLADVLAAATSSANVDMETLFETLKVAAPIGIAAGQSMEGIVSATALLGNVGIKGGRAGVVIKNALTRLAAPAGEGRKALKSLGIEVTDISGNILPLEKLMQNFGKSASKLSQVKRIAALDALFGKEALAGAINLEKAVSSGDFDKMLSNLLNAEGVANKMAKIRMDSTEGSIVQLMSAVEGLAISFGTILTPILRTTASVITQLTQPMQSFIKNNEGLITAIGVFAGIMLTAKVAALAYTASLWLVSPALTAMRLTLAALKGPMILFNFLLNANPIGVVIVAITALVSAGVYLYKNWEKVTQTFSDFWDLLTGFDFTDIFGSLGKIAKFIGLGDLFSGDTEVNKNTVIEPKQAQQAIKNNSTTNNQAIVNINIEDNKVKSVETSGNFKTDVFLDNGVQY